MINQSTMLVGKIHGKLLILDPALEETRGRALMAVRNLASHNAIAVIDSLLAQHPLPFDDAVVRSTFSPLTPAKGPFKYYVIKKVGGCGRPNDYVTT